MNMSFREKSIWISLISTLLIFGDYFLSVIALANLSEAVAKTTALELSIRAFVLIIIVEIIFQSMLAVSNRKAAKLGADERDRLYEEKVYKEKNRVKRLIDSSHFKYSLKYS